MEPRPPCPSAQSAPRVRVAAMTTWKQASGNPFGPPDDDGYGGLGAAFGAVDPAPAPVDARFTHPHLRSRQTRENPPRPRRFRTRSRPHPRTTRCSEARKRRAHAARAGRGATARAGDASADVTGTAGTADAAGPSAGARDAAGAAFAAATAFLSAPRRVGRRVRVDRRRPGEGRVDRLGRAAEELTARSRVAAAANERFPGGRVAAFAAFAARVGVRARPPGSFSQEKPENETRAPFDDVAAHELLSFRSGPVSEPPRRGSDAVGASSGRRRSYN